MAGTRAYEERLRKDPDTILAEASDFFMQRGDLHRTLRELTQRLEEAGIHYALLGAMALAHHGLVRMTLDIDLLLTARGLEEFKARYLGRGYIAAFPGATKTFRAAETGVRIEVITSGEYPGDGRPKEVRFPEPDGASVLIAGARVISLEKLIELKLASGMTAVHRRRDLADVQDLIRARRLDREFAGRLDASVREMYLQLWQEAQTEDKIQER